MSERVFNLLDGELSPYDEGPDGHRFAMRHLARELGAKLTGLTVYDVEPRQSAWPYHFELNEEEWLLVVGGELTLRTPSGERVLRAGDVACFPAGADGAHAVRNDGSVTARFAMPSSVAPLGDATVYPESGKFKLHGPGFSHRGRLGEPVEYWEGES
ncbi:MAG: cupin domain-containing protein [Gaiellaceae bacterium]